MRSPVPFVQYPGTASGSKKLLAQKSFSTSLGPDLQDPDHSPLYLDTDNLIVRTLNLEVSGA
jgi:hypothetical protein